jgi:hypothetical protein
MPSQLPIAVEELVTAFALSISRKECLKCSPVSHILVVDKIPALPERKQVMSCVLSDSSLKQSAEPALKTLLFQSISLNQKGLLFALANGYQSV